MNDTDKQFIKDQGEYLDRLRAEKRYVEADAHRDALIKLGFKIQYTELGTLIIYLPNE